MNHYDRIFIPDAMHEIINLLLQGHSQRHIVMCTKTCFSIIETLKSKDGISDVVL